MNLTASLVVRNELHRYLKPCIEHLLDFCDQIVVLDDASDDGTREYLIDHGDDRLHVVTQSESSFYVHEGQTRQRLVDETLATSPTHVLTIDADEFVSDGPALRKRLESDPDIRVWSLMMEEIWRAEDNYLYAREDGGWRHHPLPVLWKPPPPGSQWTMRDKKLACQRVPEQVLQQGGRAQPSGVSVLHFGWADPAERQGRYDRYAKHDGGRFHASAHLRSILWPDTRIKLRQRNWPEGAVFDGLRERLTVAA